MHSTSNLEDDYIGSGSRLWRSIKKYGRENHTKEILEFIDTREKLKIREKEIVNENLLSDLLCMNMKVGGDGGFSKEVQISNGIKGNQRMKWLRENDRDWLERTNEKNRDSQKKSYREGRMPVVPSWRGKKLSREHRNSIGKANSLSTKGEKNSQFGTMWINDGKVNKKVHKNSIIDSGWKIGRLRTWK
jgi:hypothetical protein